MTKQVKNISGHELSIPNIGIVASGDTIKVDESFHNSNFETVSPSSRSESRRRSVSLGSSDSESEKED